MGRTAIFILAALCVGPAVAGRERVLLISISGLRADAVRPDWMPSVSELARNGVSTLRARSLPPTDTIPNHVSMVTGLTPATHGVEEVDDPGELTVSGTVLERAHAAGLSVGLYLSDARLRLLAGPGGYERTMVTDTATAAGLVDGLIGDLAHEDGRFDLTFIQITDPDAAGRAYGWMSGGYQAAVRRADGHVGRILYALEQTGLSPRTLVILTSDHGGAGFDSSNPVPEVVLVPFIAAGPGVAPGARIERGISSPDCAPTVLRALDLPVPEVMEGRAVEEALAAGPPFLRGDPNSDGMVDLSDAITVLGVLLDGRTAPCAAGADVDSSGAIDLTDVVHLIDYLFFAGRAPLYPFPGCGRPEAPSFECRASCGPTPSS